MNNIIKVVLVVFISFLSSPSWSETISMEELVMNQTNGLVYKKFTTEPFTGSTTPTSDNPTKGSYKRGKKHGVWETFHNNGLLQSKKNYKDGKEHGVWEWYYPNGQLEWEVNWKDGKRNGEQLEYSRSGKLHKTKIYKDGKVIKTIQH